MGNPKEAELEEQQVPLLPQYSDDSDTVMCDEKIYTPPSTASNSGESQPDLHVEAVEEPHENNRLLTSSPPPSYRDTPRCQNGDVNVDIKDDYIVKGDFSPEEPRRCRGRGRFCRWWKERRRCRRREDRQSRGRSCCIKMFIVMKAVFIVWLSLWLIRWAGFMWRHHRHHHHYNQHDNTGHGCHSNSSRETVVRERTGSIYGVYPLYDLLDLKTNSGSIYVTIVPQPADPNDPLRPAKISIKSRTGNIFVRFKMPASAAAVGTASPKHGLDGKGHLDMLKAAYLEEPAMNHASWQATPFLPPRPYEIDIQTRSGNVFAIVGFSTHASITTRTGNINAHLTPLIFEDNIFPKNLGCKNCDDVSINTNTRSGNLWVSVTEPSFIASEKREHAPEGKGSPVDSKKNLDTRRNNHNRPNKWDRILEALNRKPGNAEPKPCSRAGLKVKAYHTSRWSGNMVISYPHSWAGHVTATTRNPGHILLQGDGLEVTDKSGKGKEFVGTKKPTVGRDERMSWWGSEGNMGVFLNVRRASVDFNVRS